VSTPAGAGTFPNGIFHRTGAALANARLVAATKTAAMAHSIVRRSMLCMQSKLPQRNGPKTVATLLRHELSALGALTIKRPLRSDNTKSPERAVFDAMLAGWRAQQPSRLLADTTVLWRERIVRRFAEFADGFIRGPGRRPMSKIGPHPTVA